MPIKINIYNQKAEAVGEMELADRIFGVPANQNLVHQAVVAQMANSRQVLAHTKDRSEVRGGGKKPWRQKGTGRARAGSSRSPIWKGGGVTFGPRKERNFSKKINKKMRQKAILMALSDKVASNNLLVLDKLEMDNYKTKVFNKILEGLEKILNKDLKSASKASAKNEKGKIKKEETSQAKRNILVVNDKKDLLVKYSGRNLPGVEIINLGNINIVDLLKYRDLILTVDGVKKLEERHK